jgi:hypothetical protein
MNPFENARRPETALRDRRDAREWMLWALAGLLALVMLLPALKR